MKRFGPLWGLVVLCAGCASANLPGPATRPVETSADPREAIRQLEGRIAEERAVLGLPRRAPAETGDAARGAAQEPPSPAAPQATGPAQVESASGARQATGRCQQVCQAGRDICACSARICNLAAEIRDQDSERSCQRSRDECAEAGRLCDTCR